MEIIKKKKRDDVHPYIPELKELYRKGRVTRREFLRNTAMLGMSLAAANSFLAACAREAATATSPPPTKAPEPTTAPEPTKAPEPTEVPADFPKRGGILRWDWAWIPYFADPSQDGVGTGEAARNVAETLTWVNHENIPQPLLAKSWEASEDAKEWTLHLQENVTFNNGKPFGADDVVWNLLHWLDPDVGAPMGSKLDFLSPTGVEKVDDLTVKLHLDRPNYGVPWFLYDYPAIIMPDGGADDFYKGDAEHAIGTGPYLMKEFLPDERMELVRREDYWQDGVDGKPLPYLDGIRIVAGFGAATRLAAIVGDEIDFVFPDLGILGELEANENITVQISPSSGTAPIRVRCDMAPFDDPRVRNALKWCQDRERMKELVYPLGTVAWDHWISPLHEGWCPDTDKDRPRDIDKAKALLAEAGFPDGFETEIITPTTPEDEAALCQVLKEMAAPAGIKINVNVLPDSVYWEKWDVYPFSITGWNGRMLGIENTSLGCRCGAAWNEMHWCNEEFDAALAEAEAAVDVEKRRQLFCTMQRIMQEDSGFLLPFWQVALIATRNRVQGYQAGPNPNYYFLYTWLA